ncbi:MAG: protein translocase subunit SecY [Candidatus Hydrogenedentota bacterium]
MSKPIEAFRNAFKIPELRQRIVFSLVMLAVYRLGAHIPTPGVDGAALSAAMKDLGGGLLSFYDMFTGGAFSQATILALGIMPYISASIILQLLIPVVPALEKMHKEGGAEFQRKINEWTRYGTIALCIVQSIGYAYYLSSGSTTGAPIVPNPGLLFYFICIVSFTTGTLFLMWVGEQISEFGIGNGISLIIFTSIASDMPSALRSLWSMFRNDELSVIAIGIMFLVLCLVVAGVILLTVGTRRVPVQYPRQMRGNRMSMGQRDYLPLRVNQAGVIPIIFASSILMIPGMIAQSLSNPSVESFFQVWFNYNGLLYNLVYAGMIVFFCFFYTAITFNPIEMADNLKKYGAVVMGVRPGRQTAEYLNKVMTRITFVGAFSLALVALFPHLIYMFMRLDPRVTQFFGGTSLLILVGVALDTVRQIETHLTMRNYDGFMGGRPMRSRRR